jgi:L-asparagine transporter-like permease
MRKGSGVRCVSIGADTSGMDRLTFMLSHVLIAVGLLAYSAYRDALDVEHIVAVVVFLAIASSVNSFVYRRSQRLRER